MSHRYFTHRILSAGTSSLLNWIPSAPPIWHSGGEALSVFIPRESLSLRKPGCLFISAACENTRVGQEIKL